MLLINKTIYPIQNHVPNITMDNVMCVGGCVCECVLEAGGRGVFAVVGWRQEINRT